MTQPQPKKSDLGVRVASAIVMVAVAGTALWLGGWVWTAFVAIVALGVLWEWWGLRRGFVASPLGDALWLLSGICYIGLSAFTLGRLRLDNSVIGGEDENAGLIRSLLVILVVVAIDVGAYFVGRTIGGPKIAAKISPSKTWAGLAGGSLGASLVLLAYVEWQVTRQASFADASAEASVDRVVGSWLPLLLAGTSVAIIAQVGDFFESWMKRRAGVKDSGYLIPGHGGLFDRTDGLIAVLFVLGLFSLHSLFLSA